MYAAAVYLLHCLYPLKGMVSVKEGVSAGKQLL